MTARPTEAETLDEAAAGWFARSRSGDMGPDEAAALGAWLAGDPARQEAFERMQRAWGGVEQARGDPRIMALRERALKGGARRGLARRAIAAGLAAAVLGAGALALMPREGFGSLPSQTYSTGVGKQATVTLADGSVVTLNTDTRLRTRAAKGRRLVYLDRGQAYFRVAKDPLHPFVVTAAGRTVTAVGTAFDVRAEAGRFAVTVVEGKVKVEGPPKAASAAPEAPKPEKAVMSAGSQLVASAKATTPWKVVETDAAREVSWLRGYVVFQKAPFAQVAQEMNRYTDRKIVVDDPGLAATRVSGAFKAGDVDAFVQAFEDYRVARVEEETVDAVRLARYRE